MPHLILIVDDDPILLEVLNLFLSDEGYRVVEALDGVAALELVDAEAPDLVLSDIVMPRMDGVEFVRRLRERGVGVPVILLSASVPVLDVPSVQVLRKPFDIEELVRHVGRTLGVA